MPDSWISIFTYNPADIVTPLYLAAEEYDYYPSHIHLISYKQSDQSTRNQIQSLIEHMLDYYEIEPNVKLHTVSSQFGFKETQNELNSILTSADQSGSISIDLTGEPALMNAFLFYVAANDNRKYEYIFYCSRDPPEKNADFLLSDLRTEYELHQLGEK